MKATVQHKTKNKKDVRRKKQPDRQTGINILNHVLEKDSDVVADLIMILRSSDEDAKRAVRFIIKAAKLPDRKGGAR